MKKADTDLEKIIYKYVICEIVPIFLRRTLLRGVVLMNYSTHTQVMPPDTVAQE